MEYKIAPSILSADFSRLADDVSLLEQCQLEMLHVDVMDGHFVPNLTIGPVVIDKLRPHSQMLFDVHLMLQHPQNYIQAFARAGTDSITVHVESDHNILETIQLIRQKGKKVGVSLNPDTSSNVVEGLLEHVDMVLLMTVFPGFGGQLFIEDVLPKVEQVREWVHTKGLEQQVNVQVDGGINNHTLLQAKDAGANVFVVGNYIFGQGKIVETIEHLKSLL